MLEAKRLWLGLLVSLFFLALLLFRVDLGRLASSLMMANYLFVLPGLGVYFLSLWCRTARWQYLLKGAKKISNRRLYPVVVVGYMANNLLPMRLGEVVRAYLLGSREGVEKTTALTTILLERVFDGLTLILLALSVAYFVPLDRPLGEFGVRLGVSPLMVVGLVASPFVLVLVGLFTISKRPSLVHGISEVVIRVAPTGWGDKIGKLGSKVLIGLQVLQSPQRIFVLVLLSIPIWMAESTMYYLIAFAFALDLPFYIFVFVTSVANLAITIPSTGGGVGPFEWATKVSLVALGLDAVSATGYAIVLHAALLLPVTLLGLLFLWAQSLSVGDLIRRSGTSRSRHMDSSPTLFDGDSSS